MPTNLLSICWVQQVLPDWNFNPLNCNDKWKQCKNGITVTCKNVIMTNQAGLSSQFGQTELKFSHVNEFKVVM